MAHAYAQGGSYNDYHGNDNSYHQGYQNDWPADDRNNYNGYGQDSYAPSSQPPPKKNPHYTIHAGKNGYDAGVYDLGNPYADHAPSAAGYDHPHAGAPPPMPPIQTDFSFSSHDQYGGQQGNYHPPPPDPRAPPPGRPSVETSRHVPPNNDFQNPANTPGYYGAPNPAYDQRPGTAPGPANGFGRGPGDGYGQPPPQQQRPPMRREASDPSGGPYQDHGYQTPHSFAVESAAEEMPNFNKIARSPAVQSPVSPNFPLHTEPSQAPGQNMRPLNNPYDQNYSGYGDDQGGPYYANNDTAYDNSYNANGNGSHYEQGPYGDRHGRGPPGPYSNGEYDRRGPPPPGNRGPAPRGHPGMQRDEWGGSYSSDPGPGGYSNRPPGPPMDPYGRPMRGRGGPPPGGRPRGPPPPGMDPRRPYPPVDPRRRPPGPGGPPGPNDPRGRGPRRDPRGPPPGPGDPRRPGPGPGPGPDGRSRSRPPGADPRGRGPNGREPPPDGRRPPNSARTPPPGGPMGRDQMPPRPSTAPGDRGYAASPPTDDRRGGPPAVGPNGKPLPIRAGLQPGSNGSQPDRPPPVRQYDSSSSQGKPGSEKPKTGKPKPITQEELSRLRRDAQSRPRDEAAQLALAKGLVEASTVLADEGGRADRQTQERNKDRYVKEAERMVKQLSGAGYPEAQFYLADSLSSGVLGLPNDPKEAFTLYQSAAKANHAQAAYRTAVCCEIGPEDGGGTRKDLVKALQWYKRAASLGDVPAMFKMGMINLRGLLDQPRNAGEGVEYLEQAANVADEENPHALHELGILYEGQETPGVVQKDETRALQMFTKAAKLGYKFSQFRLGQAWEYGLLRCPIEARNSIIWYTRAAAQGEHQSELALSGWYLTGSEGILEHSDTEAYLWARKAASANPPLPKALFALGYFTEVGIGCPRSLEEAKRWYARAASFKFAKAQERLDELKRGGVRVQKNRERLSRSNVAKQEQDCSLM